jgi:hypothetical protein
MGLVTIALILVAVWVLVLVFVLAIFRASGRADANEERYLAEERADMWNQSRAPQAEDTLRDERRSADRAQLEREAQRLRIELPERPHVRLTRFGAIRRHRP